MTQARVHARVPWITFRLSSARAERDSEIVLSKDARDNWRCAKCGYALQGLPTTRCPECGSPFDPLDPLSFDDIGRPSFWEGHISRRVFRYAAGLNVGLLLLLQGAVWIMCGELSSSPAERSVITWIAEVFLLGFVLTWLLAATAGLVNILSGATAYRGLVVWVLYSLVAGIAVLSAADVLYQ